MNPQAYQPTVSGQSGGYNPLAIYNQTDPSQTDQIQQTQQPTAPKPSGNWFTHLLPTAGGIGGGAAGAALGASIGSVVPILGTGIGGVLGGILGATVGGGGAKAAENVAEHQGIGNGVASTALESGLGQAAGGVAGKVLGKGAEFLANRASGITDASKAAIGTADDLGKTKVLNAIYGQSKNDVGAAHTMAQQAGLDINNPLALQDAGKSLVSNTGQALDDVIGTTKIPVSGTIDASGTKIAPSVNDLVNSSLTNTNPLTGEKLGASRSLVLGGLGSGQTDEDLLKNGFTKFLGSSSSGTANTPATGFLKEANQLLSDVNTGTDASGHDLLQAQRLVGDKAHTMTQAAAKPSANEVTQAQADSWNDLNHKLQDMIYSHPDVSQAAQNMVGTHTAANFGGNQQLADLFNSRITAAQSGQDLNGIMHDAYNMRNVGTDGLTTVNNPASTGNLKLANINNADTTNPAAPNALEIGHNALNSGGGLTKTALSAAVNLKDNPAVLNTLARVGALTAKMAPASGVAAGTSNNIVQNGGTVGDNNMQPQQTPNPTAQPANDPATAKMLFDLGLYSPGALSSIAPSQQQIQNVSNANSAATALGGLGSAPTGGIFSSIQGGLGIGKTGEYQRQAASVAQQVGSALGTDPSVIEHQLTNYMAGGGNIHDAINSLMARLHSVAQTNQTTGLGGILGVNAAPSSVTSQLPVGA